MTLRARLTGAFLAVVLGPVLVGAVFVAGTVTAVNRNRSTERLDLAASSVRTSVRSLCRQLRTVAESVALLSAGEQPAVAAQRVVDQALASAVRLTDIANGPTFTTAAPPPPPWADCSGAPGTATGVWRYAAIAARVQLRDATGGPFGQVYVAQALDLALLRRLADASGAAVTLLGGSGGPNAYAGAALSTETGSTAYGVAAAAAAIQPGSIAETGDGRYVRREAPVPDQPLPLALSVPDSDPDGLYAVLVAVVSLAALSAVAVASWLARSTTRPLAELASAADRLAGGDLAVRVPMRGPDEVGRLGTAFNRMTHELRSYVQALTASRDQLRGHLGVLGDTLSSTHDLGNILRVLLQTALAATGARAGVVLLADPAGGVLIGQCAEGLAGRVPAAQDDLSALRVPVGAGLLGGVAATREARRGRVDRDGPALAASEPRCATYMAVPLTASRPRPNTGPGAAMIGAPGAAGVLALYDRLGRDEFDDADLVTLRTLAGQAAVAVDNVRVHEEAQRLSVTDPLTGLLNYRSLTESLRREIERASRFKRMLSVLALDLDRFKSVNDSYGHSAGDAVLAECARRIRGEVREVDLAFRRGGEEFVVLLPETDAAGAVVVAERLCAAVRSAPIVLPSGPREFADGPRELADGPGAAAAGDTSLPDGPVTLSVSVTVSIGIAVYPNCGDAEPGVLEAADDALYAAKAAGRDTYRLAGATPEARPTDAAAAPPQAPVRAAARLESDPRGDTPPDGVAGGPQPPRQSRGG